MRIFFLSVLQVFLLTNCCKSGSEDPRIINEQELVSDSVLVEMQIHSLDTLLSDKISDDLTHVIRENNFHQLAGMSLNTFRLPSKLYRIQFLDNSYVVITPKQSFTHARSTSIVVHFDQRGKATEYYILNDYFIQDIIRYKDGVAVVGTDYDNKNDYWRQKNNAKICCLDKHLKERFCFETPDWRETGLPFYFDASLRNVKGNINCSLGVITGCHICYTGVEIVLDDMGKCIAINGNRGNVQSRALTQEEIKVLFY